ncbi:MAG: alpha-mannosidase [Candidatus Kapabacteria bacterium]|nr:alpha-mannosidase [Candidatus Kapabacteria bacterium]MDW8011837.1 glycoside hydrolase family 38 C-terminal domain-containing protein [Bacteroidota bacterium]
MERRKVYLLAQTHIDPVWLWDWHEGVAVTLATFRSVVQLCQRYPELRFNQNEALLYHWVELYEPELFERIRHLVQSGQWYPAGGWYLQPDCNLPCGEAMVRQILVGHRYFTRTFGTEPVVALNVDSFGHSRGLVQILARSGYRAYIFCRPSRERLPLPHSIFRWEGVDGSQVIGIRADSHYNTPLGKAAEKLRSFLQQQDSPHPLLFPWGVGNHGGGPSEIDLHALRELQQAMDWQFQHATPEEYLEAIEPLRSKLPVVRQSLRPWAVGAYTTNIRLKQLYRLAEDRLITAETMATCAALLGLLPYPRESLRRAWEAVLFCQFHDILAGTCTESATISALQRLSSALHTVDGLLYRSFIALSVGQPPAVPDEIPILVYNHHPYPVTVLLECECQPEEPNRSTLHAQPQLFSEDGTPLSCQELRPESNLPQDFRKRILFRATLQPQRMHRFSCRFAYVPPPPPPQTTDPQWIRLRTTEAEIWISRQTGLLERYRVHGREYARAGMASLLVIPDSADAWGMWVRHFRRKARHFRLLPKALAAWFAGVPEPLHPVRIIEDGPLCTVVEALFHHRYRSFACLHYVIPREGAEIELRLRLYWNERDSLLKLAFPTRLLHARLYGQSMFAVEELPTNGSEQVAQRWVCLVEEPYALSCITDTTYGVDCHSGELRLSLVRSPAYSGHPVAGVSHIAPPDRFTPRIDQGEHRFRFWLNAGESLSRLQAIEREAHIRLRPPLAYPFPPARSRAPVQPLVHIEHPSAVLTALKLTEDADALIVRLWESTGQQSVCRLLFPAFGYYADVELQPYAVTTFRIDLRDGTLTETDLLERPLSSPVPLKRLPSASQTS